MNYWVLHVADPHFSNSHFADTDPSRIGVLHANEILQILALAKLGHRKFDAMVVSGDLTFRYDPRGFDAAAAFLNALAPEVRSGGILVIPGNHDIDLGKGQDIVGRLSLPVMKQVAENAYRQFLERMATLLGQPNWYLSSGVRIAKGHERGLVLLALNSCRVERRDAQGWGYIGIDQIHDAGKALLSPASGHHAHEGDTLLAFVHHNLLPIWDIGLDQIMYSPGYRKFSFIIDAASAISELANLRVSAIFHGHTHVQSVKRVGGYGNGTQADALTWILGSASLGLNDRSCVPHHFQVIKVAPESLGAEITIYDFTCSYHLRGTPRQWIIGEGKRFFVSATWDEANATQVLDRMGPRSHTAKADYEVMKSWAVLRSKRCPEAWPTELDTIYAEVKKVEPGATLNAVENIINNLVQSPPRELDITQLSLEEFILNQLRLSNCV
jgi:hypothetical protein